MKVDKHGLAFSGWKKTPAALFLGSWVLLNLLLSLMFYSINSKAGGTTPIATLFIAVLICMATPQTPWNIWKRMGYVLFSWVGVSLLGVVTMLFLMGPLMALGLKGQIDSLGNIVAGSLFLIIAMKQSRLFIYVDQPKLGNA